MNTKISFFPILAIIGLFLLLPQAGVRAAGVTPAYRSAKEAGLPRTAPPVRLNRFQRQRLQDLLLQRERLSAASAEDTLRLAVLQVQFADSLMGGQEGSRRPEVRDSTFFANEMEHLADYFTGASRGRLTLTWEILPPIYTLPEGMGYYGLDALEEFRVVEMVQSAIDLADGDVDFSSFDAVVVIHAGAGQETDQLGDSRGQLWSSFYDLDDIQRAFPDSAVTGLATGDSLSGEPFFVDSFLLLPANSSQDGLIIGSLGIWSFVMGSRLGLLPLYDSTPPGFEDSRGVGNFCLMAAGLFDALGFVPAFPCAFNRMLAGWVDPVLVEENGQFRLRDINSPLAGDTACLKIPVTEGEYFLVVNRVHDTNFDSLFTFTDFDSNLVPDNTDSLGGAEFDFFLTDVTNPEVIKPDPNYGGLLRRYVSTGSGIYIWHIDEKVIREAVQTGFLPDDFVDRKGVDLEEADGVQDLDGTDDQSFSYGSYWDSFRRGHNDRFAPDSNPSSEAYSGASTGITVDNISKPGLFMECRVSFSQPYAERRVRWDALGAGQPPTPVNLDGSGEAEIVVLADTGRVYVFNADGTEYVDGDMNPQTIEPLVSVPEALWTGAPAFGDVDGDGELEIVASSTDGRLFAWNADGSEVIDGDSDPLTDGILYRTGSFAAPPMLVDVSTPSARCDIAVVERSNDSLYVRWIDGTGSPTEADPVGIKAQAAAAPALMNPADGSGIVVVAWIDTVEGNYGLSFAPESQFLAANSSRRSAAQQVSEPQWSVLLGSIGEGGSGGPSISAPAAGDLDGDGDDEVVVVFGNEHLAIVKGRPPQNGDEQSLLQVIDLRGSNPSAPSLGDVDGDGTLEIACRDEDYYYLFKHNGASYTDWPRPIRTVENLDLPPLVFNRIRQSPLIGDINGDGRIEILYPDPLGVVNVFGADGSVPAGFPRNVPDGLLATPSLSDVDGELSLIACGAVPGIEGRDAVADTITGRPQTILSLQSLPASASSGDLFWALDRANGKRWGRATPKVPLAEGTALVESNSFMIYPNPVGGREVRVRVTLNRRARVIVDIYNLEGERALSREFSGNPGGVIQTPFDESLDVAALKSGVYFLRLQLDGAGEASTLVKTFAIRR